MIILLAFFLFSVSSFAGPQTITKNNVIDWIAERYQGGCEDPRSVAIEEGNFILKDLDGDSVPEVLVTAHTCITGSGGPETFVLKRDASGKLVELQIAGDFRSLLPLPLVGNISSVLRVTEGGKIFEDYGDGVKIFYEVKDGKLFPVKAELPPLGEPSFKCAGDKLSELEIAICWDQESSTRDRELMQTYRDLHKTLSGAEKTKLEKDQIKWIKKRNKECRVYKWHYECLKEMYTKRIESLKRRLFSNPKSEEQERR